MNPFKVILRIIVLRIQFLCYKIVDNYSGVAIATEQKFTIFLLGDNFSYQNNSLEGFRNSLNSFLFNPSSILK